MIVRFLAPVWNRDGGDKLTVLEACDTRRQLLSVTDDGFGIGCFLHLAGVPTLLLADWEVRSDVSLVFMNTFYEALPSGNETKIPASLGYAYKKAVSATRDQYGADQFFLWPFYTGRRDSLTTSPARRAPSHDLLVGMTYPPVISGMVSLRPEGVIVPH